MISQYVFYGKIDLTLKSVLKICGEVDAETDLVVNGEGTYLIPASSFTGAVRSYLEGCVTPNIVDEFFGSKDERSRVIIYDAEIQLNKEHSFEERIGVRIDKDYGTSDAGKLFTEVYIAKGATATVLMEAYCSKENEFINLFDAIVQGFNDESITLGSDKTNGAGVFSAKGKRKVIDLKENMQTYLKGINAYPWYQADKSNTTTNASSKAMDTFILEASIPDGLLVGSGSGNDEVNKVNMTHANGKYYIPGTSIKGVIRAYVRKIVSYLKLDDHIIGEVFGYDDNSAVKSGCVNVEDCELADDSISKTIYNRIKIDRLLGGTIGSAKMTEEVLSTKQNKTITIKVRLNHKYLNDTQEITDILPKARALVYLAMRDLGAGYFSIGSGNSVGHGRLQGITLAYNDQKYSYNFSNGIAQIKVDNKDIEDAIKALTEA